MEGWNVGFGTHLSLVFFQLSTRRCHEDYHVRSIGAGNRKEGEESDEDDTVKKEEEKKSIPVLSHSVITVVPFVAVNAIFKSYSFSFVAFEKKRDNQN